MMSKLMRSLNHPQICGKPPPCKSAEVLFVAVRMTGTATGNSRMGSITSLDLVFADIAEKRVPTLANPTVPKTRTAVRGNQITVSEMS